MGAKSFLLLYIYLLAVYCQPPQSENGECCRSTVNNIHVEVPADSCSQQGHGFVGSLLNPAESCKDIKSRSQFSKNGLYYISTNQTEVYPVYCNMDIDQGGWTLVASIHENNIKGRCTPGDRWSTEQGNNADHPHGDGFWENRATHGMPSSATSDDYKNAAYFDMHAKNMMIYHVPNDTPLKELEIKALYKYYTTNNFLSTYGGNLQALFSSHFPIRKNTYTKSTDNGPAVPVMWNKGGTNSVKENYGSKTQGEVDGGFIQFRVVNHEREAFAICPGVRMKAGYANCEHPCIGSTTTRSDVYCGDYAAKDYTGSGGWSASVTFNQAVTMIYYR